MATLTMPSSRSQEMPLLAAVPLEPCALALPRRRSPSPGPAATPPGFALFCLGTVQRRRAHAWSHEIEPHQNRKAPYGIPRRMTGGPELSAGGEEKEKKKREERGDGPPQSVEPRSQDEPSRSWALKPACFPFQPSHQVKPSRPDPSLSPVTQPPLFFFPLTRADMRGPPVSDPVSLIVGPHLDVELVDR